MTENLHRVVFLVCLCSLGGYRWMITPEMLHQTAGQWYIEAKPVNSSTVSGLKLQISLFTTKCLYWDERNQTWSTAGCQVGVPQDLVAFSRVSQCLCTDSVTSCDLRWGRRALQRERSVCVTTSRCSGAPSSSCPTTWTSPGRRSCSPP